MYNISRGKGRKKGNSVRTRFVSKIWTQTKKEPGTSRKM